MLALTELPYVTNSNLKKVYPTSRIALSVGPLVCNKISATLYIAAVYDVVMIMIIIIIHVSCDHHRDYHVKCFGFFISLRFFWI